MSSSWSGALVPIAAFLAGEPTKPRAVRTIYAYEEYLNVCCEI